MDQACWAFPILPGRGDLARVFLGGLASEHQNEYQQSSQRLELDKALWFRTDGAGGEQLVFYLEGTDVHRSYDGFVRSRDPFDLWFKARLAEVCVLDLNDPLEGTRPPELLAGFVRELTTDTA